MPCTINNMAWNRTGSWRFLTPILQDKISPCRDACPAGIDISGFISEVGCKDYERAWQIIVEENPFPSVCGRVCGHPCEGACNRKEFDDPLVIHALERFVGDHGLAHELKVQIAKAHGSETIAVVGSGPAGLSCAYHLRRLGYTVEVFERSPLPGGMLGWGIPDYRLPPTVLGMEIERLRDMGIKIETNVSLDSHFLTDGLREFRAIFLALGAQKDLHLGIPGEDLKGVLSGLDFLRGVKGGNPPALGKRVILVGGGNTAIDVARTALRLGSAPTLIYRRTRTEMPAVPSEIEEALKEGVRIEFLTSPVVITRLTGQQLQLECVRNRLGELGPDGRRTPLPMGGSNFLIVADTIVVAIGEGIDSDPLIQSLKETEAGIKVDEWGGTQIPGVFAGGDLTAESRTVPHAIGSGKKVAIAIDAFVRGLDRNQAQSVSLGSQGSFSMSSWINPPSETHRSDQVVTYEDLNTSYFEHRPREKVPQLSEMGRRIGSFGEVNLGFGEKAAIEEAERCFHCGTCNLCQKCALFCPDASIYLNIKTKAIEVDLEHCKGCGICAYECPGHVIIMENIP